MTTRGARWPEGLASAIDAMKPIVQESYSAALTAKYRLWAARDLVDRLRSDLTAAEAALALAQRDHEECGEFMLIAWSDFRAKVEQIPVHQVDSATTVHAGAQRSDAEGPGK